MLYLQWDAVAEKSHEEVASKLGFRTELLVEVVWVTSESTDADRMKNCVTVSTNAFDIESSLNQWSCFRKIWILAVVDDEVNVEEVVVVTLCWSGLTKQETLLLA